MLTLSFNCRDGGWGGGVGVGRGRSNKVGGQVNYSNFIKAEGERKEDSLGLISGVDQT